MAILPVPKLFKVIKGGTFDYRFQYLSGNSTSSTPVNLTGYTARWTITTLVAPYTTLATYTTGGALGVSGVVFGGDLHDPATGIIDLIISSTDTAAITWTTARYNLTITDSFNVVSPLLTGSIGVVGSLP